MASATSGESLSHRRVRRRWRRCRLNWWSEAQKKERMSPGGRWLGLVDDCAVLVAKSGRACCHSVSALAAAAAEGGRPQPSPAPCCSGSAARGGRTSRGLGSHCVEAAAAGGRLQLGSARASSSRRSLIASSTSCFSRSSSSPSSCRLRHSSISPSSSPGGAHIVIWPRAGAGSRRLGGATPASWPGDTQLRVRAAVCPNQAVM